MQRILKLLNWARDECTYQSKHGTCNPKIIFFIVNFYLVMIALVNHIQKRNTLNTYLF